MNFSFPVRTEPQSPGLSIYRETEYSGPDAAEYRAVIRNESDVPVFLRAAVLLDTQDLTALGLGGGPYRVFRSGRHKNDMPGVFQTGCPDQRLADVASVMAEQGGSMEAGESRRVVSDHLTLIEQDGVCLALEFLTGRDQLFQTVLTLDRRGRLTRLTAETLFGILLSPGQCVKTETLRVALTRDAEGEIDAFARRKATLYGSRRRRRPAVFCTWYYYGLTVTYADVKECLRQIRQRRLPYDVFQVDEGWEVTLGHYEPNEKFPLSMADLAREIRDAGCTPGLWSSPFIAHESAPVWREHPEWMLRQADGTPCLFPMNGTVYRVLDITHPGTWDYFRSLYRRFTREWGYPYHKLDFTRAPVIFESAAFHDRTITLAQAYYRAVKAIRDGMGEDGFLLICGGLYDPAIGLADAQRTGADVLSMWQSSVQQGGKTAPYTIRQSILRAYMNAWWDNDPDALMIRENPEMKRGLRLTLGLLTDEEVKTVVMNQFMGGGIMCQTEPLDAIRDSRLLEIRRILPVLDTRVRPLGLLSGGRFPDTVDVLVEKTGAHCLCLINWDDEKPRFPSIRLADLPLEENADYAVCDYYAGTWQTARKKDTVAVSPIPPHGAAMIKIEKIETGRPVVVASDGHYAMGAEFDTLAVSRGRLHIRLKSVLPIETHYRVLLPEGRGPGRQREISFTMGPDCEERVFPLPDNRASSM